MLDYLRSNFDIKGKQALPKEKLKELLAGMLTAKNDKLPVEKMDEVVDVVDSDSDISSIAHDDNSSFDADDYSIIYEQGQQNNGVQDKDLNNQEDESSMQSSCDGALDKDEGRGKISALMEDMTESLVIDKSDHNLFKN